jgi:(1->4)-alpha-D-glucan 1-alpha-D-glucosylmutase
MAIGTADNRLWWDVLENGPASQYASFFDVDWQGGTDTRVLLPILGEPYVDALAHGLVRLTRDGATFTVAYYEHRFPAAPRSLGAILHAAAGDHEELGFLASAYAELPAPTSTDRENVERRQRDKQVLAGYLERLLCAEPALAKRIDDHIEGMSGSVTELDAWLERQNWRLSHWRSAATELGYRRFFDVQTLAGLRVEEERVFERVHKLVLSWLRDGTIAGLRIDHIDGLLDPEKYLQRLRAHAPHAWIVVEKITQADETLPGEWPVDGTTGYELMRLLDQVFVDPSAAAVLGPLDEAARGDARLWAELVSDAKRQILDEVLGSERERLIDVTHRALRNRVELRDCTRV